MRLKVLEETLRGTSSSSTRTRTMSNGPSRRQSLGGSENLQNFPSNGTSKSFDGGTRSLDRGKALLNGPGNYSFKKVSDDSKEPESVNGWKDSSEEKTQSENTPPAASEDSVLGVLYDLLQKEVVSLRKASHEKDQSLKDKDDAIEMLAKKVETLTKAMEIEAKKMRREVAAMEKEVVAMRVEKDQDNRERATGRSG
ncbi:unnamed protein product [Eruca vesicaria subsp. sativa]|uniref:Uncharacterized protein n=1 Tax=Eruca vesicaria subsp. sativa TaxID=29727 RepID=A0ABC8K0R3_ERUVS|nr:unnamed protein product [Eruca vesicaria subsp. sativa]